MASIHEKSKRNRALLACDRCRRRKSKCDGCKPCKPCTSKKLICTYEMRDGRSKATAEYVKQLEERLGITKKRDGHFVNGEDKTNESSNINFEVDHDHVFEFNSPKEDMNQTIINEGTEHLNGRRSVFSLSEMEFPVENNDILRRERNSREGELNEEKSVEDTDAMGAGSVLNNKDYYGSSAAISFMKELVTIIDGNDKSQTNSPRSPNRYTMSRKNRTLNNIQLQDLAVPPRSIADKYVKNYFEFAYPLYPFVHKPTFMATYEQIWSALEDEEIDELFFSITNIIFALGCELTPGGANPSSESYFNRSHALLKFNLMDNGSLLLVQALLLTGQYLQATRRLAGCWNTIGVTIRFAQGLGLHIPEKNDVPRSLIEIEMRKRIWHGCLLMDRVVSMTLGRPLMITEQNSIAYPLSIDDENITDLIIHYNPPGTPSHVHFFIQCIKLYDILADIHKKFYSVEQPDYEKLYLDILSLDQSLNNFKDEVPKFLQLETSIQEQPYFRQSIILRIRFLHLKIMLVRPALFAESKLGFKVVNSKLYQDIQYSLVNLCVSTAIELIDLINSYRSGDIIYLPAHWYNVYYIYTAVTVLLAAKLQHHLYDQLDIDEINLSWKSGIDLLNSYKLHSDTASQCVKILTMVEPRVNQALINNRDSHLDKNLNNQSEFENSEIPTDILYSVLYGTGPFDPFLYPPT